MGISSSKFEQDEGLELVSSDTHIDIENDDVTELAKETKLSESEIRKSYKVFLSNYPDGRMNVDQLKAVYANFYPNGNASEFAGFVFRTYDANGDGQIDFREFITALSVIRRGTSTEKMKWLFSLYDLDSNGFISKPEMLQVLSAIYKMTGNRTNLPADEATPGKSVDKIFSLMDTNGDDLLSLSEFMTGVVVHPSLRGLLQSPQGLMMGRRSGSGPDTVENTSTESC